MRLLVPSLGYAVLLIVWITPVRSCADGPWSVGRVTIDRDSDLIAALTQRERYDEALAITAELARGADPIGDASAKAVIRQSRILVAKQMGQPRFSEEDILSVTTPVNELLNSYPDHPRRWFLRAQLTNAQQNAALHSVLRAAVSPANDSTRDEATRSLLQATKELEQLSNEIRDARIQMDQQRDDRPLALIADLARLQQELLVDTVSLALMQTELFAAGSDDCIAAATRAEQLAEQAIAKLPSGTQARREIERLRVEAIFRALQLDRADQVLKTLVEDPAQPLSTRLLALQTRLDMSQERMLLAENRLSAFYGSDPINAPRSIEMDLARLEYALRSGRGAATGDWLDAIQARGGAYARRRAEALALSLLGRPTDDAASAVDPAIVAAQGQDYLRRGDVSRASELLAAAARAEADPARAIARAAEAAAAFGLANRHREATDVLSEVSLLHPEVPAAPTTHLQAAFLAASYEVADANQLESMLRENLKRWPDAETASSSRAWLQKILKGQGRLIEAAEVATAVSPEDLSAEGFASIAEAWQTAFDDDVNSSDLSRRFLVAFRPLLKQPAGSDLLHRLAALLVDRDLLDESSRMSNDASIDPFIKALLDFRKRGATGQLEISPPKELAAGAAKRLMRDGRQDKLLQPAIAREIDRWDNLQSGDLERAERMLWRGDTESAQTLLSQWVKSAPGSAENVRKVAQLFGAADTPEAKQLAVAWWDRLSAGTAKGSDSWHEAKLRAIALLRSSGKQDEADRRARYVLLTMPTMDQKHRLQYQALVK